MRKGLQWTVSIAMALCMMLMLMPTGAFAATASDISGNWAKDTIQSWMNEGLIKGYPDGTFKPDQNITRAEFMTLVNRAFNYTEVAATNYTDVKSGSWYATEVAKAKAAGYITGYPGGMIEPDNPISREEVATIIMKINKLEANPSAADTFTDAASLTWSKGAVGAVFAAGLMAGYPDGSFGPQKLIKRGEATIALDRAMKYIAGPVTPLAPSVTRNDDTTGAAASVDGSALIVAPVDLGTAGNYAILAKTGISTVPTSAITGDIGVSPVAATGITGFGLVLPAGGAWSTSSQVTGKVYAPGYADPTPANLTTAISNMETAYTDAAGRAANYTELYAGDISGKTLTAGVYKWSTDVLINTDVTLNGGANDVWIFQIAGKITQASNKSIILTGGAQAKNIFWQAADTVAIGTGAHFEGIILGMTNITLGTNASINGRLLAQTAVTLQASTVTGLQ